LAGVLFVMEKELLSNLLCFQEII